ncbi:MAG: NAD-dependent epimerase/dehydratase family protein [Rhodococcus sp.]|uniref:NAD-dependent epimerase/dehydratase family protein n=1 Tax=Rhodococcus sp. TaxID=1831 RepID=UPI00168F6249|nr:NAD-dependent epimerase/dehydratase family protein [Rhodococcus sp. (in: high G+C Gram-positive bacteria)]NLV79633.1 NAD-dependent epimerase/dehydratase family protein [Rhodococcus sp. (in: high G+C Gram-positive bacteria)]
MQELHVVAGAGPVGHTVAAQLAEQGHRVRVLTRSGSGPDHPNVERLRVDVNDRDALAGAVRDGTGTAVAVYMCIHGSAYRADVWERELPGAETTVLDAAGAVGAAVVFPESLYSYRDTDRPMTEDSPRDASGGKRGVRTRLLAARAAHATPTVSVVASDFFGPHVRTAHAGERMVPVVLAGRTVRVLGSPDVPHSFTYVPDLAAAMIAAAGRPDLWNRVLHAPTAPALTQRELAGAYATAAGLPSPSVGAIPSWMVRAGSVVSRDMRELAEMLYQFTDPFVMDSTATEKTLGSSPTPLPEAAAATVRWWQNR